MREIGVQGFSRRGRRQQARSSQPAAAPAPDLVKRRFRADRPDQLWLADITYIPTWEGWLVLGVVMDVCTRRIVGWSMRDDLHAEIVIDALGMAVTRRQPSNPVIHHSDRGSQYASLAFGTTLRESGLLASMGSRGDWRRRPVVRLRLETIRALGGNDEAATRVRVAAGASRV